MFLWVALQTFVCLFVAVPLLLEVREPVGPRSRSRTLGLSTLSSLRCAGHCCLHVGTRGCAQPPSERLASVRSPACGDCGFRWPLALFCVHTAPRARHCCAQHSAPCTTTRLAILRRSRSSASFWPGRLESRTGCALSGPSQSGCSCTYDKTVPGPPPPGMPAASSQQRPAPPGWARALPCRGAVPHLCTCPYTANPFANWARLAWRVARLLARIVNRSSLAVGCCCRGVSTARGRVVTNPRQAAHKRSSELWSWRSSR